MAQQQKTIGIVFIDHLADWEYGLLAASAVEWLGARVVALTPEGDPVRSTAGFQVSADRDFDPAQNEDLDALALIGSDCWASADAPDVAPLLKSVAGRGGVIGGICGATLPLAKAGLFADAKHTSNGREWINEHVPGYAGAANYIDTPKAVADGRIVSAAGTAPVTFAANFLRLVFPDQEPVVQEMQSFMSREHA
ncbi:DJ-1/PfpI family protein [Nitratireductor luteus]|uniref:DJ-1/PfpI family protein n=1 Tax=Nitratireductor luteus TaxID=2976980 RepID=UPI002240B667|nr:DJ-1/PfpI family protein [Nitratireductor luteus]